MPPAINSKIRDQVIKEWLSGYTRDEIAPNNGIGAGKVSNIISEFKKGVESTDYESIRDLAQFLKREGISMSDLATHVRLINYIKRLGANLGQIESFIGNIVDSQDPHKLLDTANEIAQLSKSDSIPLDMMKDHIKRRQEEIEKAGAILDQENIDIQIIEDHKKLEDQLKKYGISTEAPCKLISVLRKFDETGYDSQKIVTNYTHVKSLRQTIRGLKKECRMLESRAVRYKEILPLCEQVDSFGMGFPELVVFRSSVFRVAEMEDLPPMS